MPPEVFTDIEQGSDAWRALRAGLATASHFQELQRDKNSKTRSKYLKRLAQEIITGEPSPPHYMSADMQRGHSMEDEARNMYALVHDEEIRRVAFIRNGPKGASPDALVGDRGGLEIKTQLPHLKRDPSKHIAQIQGNIWVAERDFWDLIVYWPTLPLYSKRIWRDDVYVKNLATAVEQFNSELAELVEQIRVMQ